jgi:hypothetical protein
MIHCRSFYIYIQKRKLLSRSVSPQPKWTVDDRCVCLRSFSHISADLLSTWCWLKPWRDNHDACGVEIRMYEMHGVGAFAQISKRDRFSANICSPLKS